jgi:glycosyltransferase involved in cell wall biosynthesis
MSNQNFTFHLPQLPHVVISDETTSCAFSGKVKKFARMMHERGHTIIFYGHPDSEVTCDEHVIVTDDQVLHQAYGDYDWRGTGYRHNVTDHAYTEFNRRMIPEISARARPLDILCLPFGIGHEPVARAVQPLGVIPVETGIGHTTGSFADYRIYESHAVRNAVEGMTNPQRWYSWVIPNYFDLDDFEYSDRKQDYILYLGRITEIKGITTCIQATAAAGRRLKIAGQGNLESLGYHQLPDHVEFVGYANRARRRELMRDAAGLIIASTYNEPFGGVQVEALLSGTPIITPFFGAFAEVNVHQVTGYQCHTLREFAEACGNVDHIHSSDCRAHGLKYSLEAVAPEFERYFSAVQEIYTGQGWNQL